MVDYEKNPNISQNYKQSSCLQCVLNIIHYMWSLLRGLTCKVVTYIVTMTHASHL